MAHEFKSEDLDKIIGYIKDVAAAKAYDMFMNEGPAILRKDFPVEKLADKLIAHFVELEEYEKCANIQEVLAQYQCEQEMKKIFGPNNENNL